MNWKHLLESASKSVNDDLRLRNEYLMAENRILRNQIDGRVQLTDSERRALAEIGAKLGKKALAEIATVAQPDTILAWNRKFAKQKVTTSKPSKPVGRPCVDHEIEALVLRMAQENRSWGYDRIQGGLHHLGYTISDQTVGNILKRHGISPVPERKKTVTWREFIQSHWDVLLATDFFNSKVWSWFGLAISYLFGLIRFSRDPVNSVGMILHDQVDWLLSVVPQRLDLTVHIEKSRYSVEEMMPPWLLSFGKSLQPQPLSELPSDNLRESQSQGRDHVVLLSAVNPGPIRDGPIRCRQHLSTLRCNNERRVA